MGARIDKIADDLFLITLCPPIAGFDDFIGVWARMGQPSFIVDVGPAATAADLLRALADLGLRQPDYIFLTHIHLDHAGAMGEIAARFTAAPIICHPAGIPHLIDPAHLWAGTQKVLGAWARAYGPLKPVPAGRLLAADRFENPAVTPILTPGHAAHHVSFRTPQYLFAGETGGVFLPRGAGRFYLRPATPPRFFFDTALRSLDALIATQPSKMCYGHYGLTDEGLKLLRIHRGQLLFWGKTIADVINRGHRENFTRTCLQRLLKEDRLLEGFRELPAAVQAREEYFLQNSIRGYAGYLAACSPDQGAEESP